MGRGYAAAEIRQKIISAMEGSESGMSGVEIAAKVGVGRITMAKYLKVFAAEGLLRQKEIGNITLWFLEPDQESFEFPEDYFKVAARYLDLLTKGTEEQACSLVRNCLHSGAAAGRLVLEAILPAIGEVDELFDGGKVGTAERNLLRGVISRSLQAFQQSQTVPDPAKNVILISADSASSLLCESAAAMYRAEGWRVYQLGDMSAAADVLFDLDFEKLVGKVWRQKPGILLTVVFSETDAGLNFFADAIKPTKAKAGKKMRLALCGTATRKAKAIADMASEEVGDVMQWSQTVSGGA